MTQNQLGVIDSNLKKVKYLGGLADSIQDYLPLKERKQRWSACDVSGGGTVKERIIFTLITGFFRQIKLPRIHKEIET